jgi:O-antigen ligase
MTSVSAPLAEQATLRKPGLPNAPLHIVNGANRPATADRVILFSTIALLLFSPLAFGAVEAWAKFVIEAGSMLLLLGWVLHRLHTGQFTLVLNLTFAPMLAFGALISTQLAAGQTVYREQTVRSAMLYVAYGVMCFLVVQTFNKTSYLRYSVAIFVVYGTVVAAFALVQGLSSSGKLYWLKAPASGGWIYGPYVNHNHYAGLMELLVPLALVSAFTRNARGPHKVLAIAASVVMACTIFLSGSRGGMLAFGVQLLLLFWFLARTRRHRDTIIAACAFILVCLGTLAWIGGEGLLSRFASLRSETHAEISGGTRLRIDQDTLRMFTERPIMGWGLGVFADVYPRFRSFYSEFQVNAAHNDYLQFLAETGVLGFLTLLWFLLTVYRSALKKVGNWQRDINGALAVAMILSMSGLLVHSLIDFNLQVPANAALFYVFCTLAAIPARFYTRQSRISNDSSADF